MDILLIILIVLAFGFNFLNGLNDSSNIVATVITSRALPPRAALILTAIGEFIGPFLFGVAVAETVGKGLLDPAATTPQVMISALVGAITWNIAAQLSGIPSSSSHSLMGGLLGAAIYAKGFKVVILSGLYKILLALFLSPILGLFAGFLITKIMILLFKNFSPKINTFFKRFQIVTSFGLALAHGGNDAQKIMGVITLGLFSAGYLDSFEIPFWVIVGAAAAIALGTSFGGWRLIRTLGGKIMRIRPIHGLASQIAGASVIFTAAIMGGPVSTTQVMSTAIMGTGAAERVNKVRWQVLQQMLIAWLLTIPVSATIAAICYIILTSLGI